MINVGGNAGDIRRNDLIANLLIGQSQQANNGTFLGALSAGLAGALGGAAMGRGEMLRSEKSKALAQALAGVDPRYANIAGSLDSDAAQNLLVRALDPSLAMNKERFGYEKQKDARDFDFRKAQADRDYGLSREGLDYRKMVADRDYGLLNRKFDYQKEADAQDRQQRERMENQQLLEVFDPQTGGTRYATAEQVRSNPYDYRGKTKPKAPSDAERKSAGFSDRMNQASIIMSELENKGYNPASVTEAMRGLTNFTASTEKQMYDQAASNWVRANLRLESGAVIGADEMQKEIETYFPRPGDSPEVIAQKSLARATVENNMRRNAGSAALAPQQTPIPDMKGWSIERIGE